MPRKRRNAAVAHTPHIPAVTHVPHIPASNPDTIIQQNRDIQSSTLKKMIDSKNPSVQFRNITEPLSNNVNYKLILVNGQQQDMLLCTTCSKLEFSDELESHQCDDESISYEMEEAETIPAPDVVPHKIMKPTTHGKKLHSRAKEMLEEILDFSLDELPDQIVSPPTPVHQIHPRNMAIMKEQLALSFAEMFPLEALNDVGFKAMTKYLLNVGATKGKINVTDVLGDRTTFEKERDSLVFTVKSFLKKVVAEEKLVFSCDLWKHPFHSKRCVTLSSHYIDDGFVLHRNVLGTRILNENEFDGSLLDSYVTDILSEYTSTPASILSNATIVTQKSEDFLKSFRNYGRLNCTCTILNDVVNHSLSLPCFQTENVCKAIKIRLERQPMNEKYKNVVANLQLNDWFSIWHLFEAYQQYLATTTPCKNIISDYEMLYKFVLESRNASRLLSSNKQATVSTVYLIKKKLIDVMRGNNVGLFRWPEYKDKLTSYAENTFEITDVHRITLFLDPRYKSLKFLSKEERDALHDTVRGIIGEIFAPDENLRALLKLGKHVAWVDSNGMAEVDNYLSLTNISPDTNVLEFWKLHIHFPKLRTLAKEMLCIPAVSAAWECYFNEDKFNLSRRRLHLSLDEIDTTLLLNGFGYGGMFDEELKSLFGP